MNVFTNMFNGSLLQKLLLFLAVLVILALTTALWVRNSSLPKISGKINVTSTGLREDTQIIRDEYGVPHIRARNDEDAFFALGFVHWQDRAWQMDLQRRIAQGRLAEILGEDALEQDKFLRTWGFQKSATNTLPILSKHTRKLIASYTAGVNASMNQNKKALEFRILSYTPDPWTEVDSISWSKLMAYDLSSDYEDEILALKINRTLGSRYLNDFFPDYPKNAPTVLSKRNLNKENDLNSTDNGTQKPNNRSNKNDNAAQNSDTESHHHPIPKVPTTPESLDSAIQTLQASVQAAQQLGLEKIEGKGSNGWVISGQRSLTGKPILANDPHLNLKSPMFWYLADVQGSKYKAIGASIPGLPVIVIGRNEQIAWGTTNLDADAQDLFVVSKNQKLTSRTEIIRVKGQTDVNLQVRDSEYGPVISDLGKSVRDVAPRVALHWNVFATDDTTLDAFVKIGYASNWSEFRKGVALFTAPSQNFVYADTKGNIGYQASGKIPIRKTWQGTMPMFYPQKRANSWQGYIPAEDMPHTLNPSEGFLFSSNNKVRPYGNDDTHRLAAHGQWPSAFRAERLQTLLNTKERGWTTSDMEGLQLDNYSQFWEQLKPYLMNTRPDGDLSAKALYKLRDWNGKQTLQSVESTLFEAWLQQLSKMAQDELDKDVFLSSQAILAQVQKNGVLCKNRKIKQVSCKDELRNSLKRAVLDLNNRLGSDMQRWTYDRLHIATHPHAAFGKIDSLSWLFNHPVPVAGGTHTLNVGTPYAGDYTVRNGPSYRQVVNLARPNQSVYIGSLGQSGNPLSPYSTNQQKLWSKGNYLPMSTDSKDWGRQHKLTLHKMSN